MEVREKMKRCKISVQFSIHMYNIEHVINKKISDLLLYKPIIYVSYVEGKFRDLSNLWYKINYISREINCESVMSIENGDNSL